MNINDLEEILNQIDGIGTHCELDIKALNYSELLCLHFLLETNQSFGVIKLDEEKFPFQFSQSIMDGLIEKKYLSIFKIDVASIYAFLNENLQNLESVQKSYLELLIKYSSEEAIKLTQQKIEFLEFRDLVSLELKNCLTMKYEDIVAMEVFIKHHQKEKSLFIFKELVGRYNLNIKTIPSLTFKLESLAWSHSIVNVERLLTITCRSISADLRRNRHSLRFLPKLFMNRLDYFSNKKAAGAQLVDNGESKHKFFWSIIDDFIEQNLSLSTGTMNSLSGFELINLWMNKPKIDINLRQLIN
ncbi:hypothetical protein [Methylophilus sp.]|jgi:hypothetical protein|uniref:hypothetical protein n=1 Tax=Methylophilus sp. TaxID=29541 RepID=UPI0040355C0C